MLQLARTTLPGHLLCLCVYELTEEELACALMQPDRDPPCLAYMYTDSRFHRLQHLGLMLWNAACASAS
jgi:hypothetical protein